jgi:cytoskeletal protein RodZ
VRRPPAATGSVGSAGPGDSPAHSRGIGAWLARQRRLRGISLDELEALTRVPRRSLERLEAGAYDASPDGFARGFVRTVASAIGLDPDDAVSRMLSEVALPPPRRRSRAVPALLVLASLLGLAGLLALASGLLPIPQGWGLPAVAPNPAEARRRDFVSELAADVAAGRVAVPAKPVAAGQPAAPPGAGVAPGPAPAPDAAVADAAAAAEATAAPAALPASEAAPAPAPAPGAEPLASPGAVAPH